MNPIGFLLPAATIGLGSLLIRPRRGLFPYNTEGEALFPIVAQVTLEERHSDELEISVHPVEQGAAIADHAFKKPAEVIIRCAWSDSPSGPGSIISQAVGVGAAVGGTAGRVLAGIPGAVQAAQSLLGGNDQGQVKQIYQKLLQLQSDRVPFDVMTGKRSYTNMLMRSLHVDTDQHSENILSVTMVLQQVLIMTTQAVSVPSDPSAMSDPEDTAPIEDMGAQSLQPDANMSQDKSTMLGSFDDTSSLMADLETTITSGTSELTGPLSEVQGALGETQEALASVKELFPAPSELPLQGVNQELTVPLGPADLTGAQESALGLAKDSLTRTDTLLRLAEKQVIANPASAPAGTLERLGSTITSVGSSLSTIKRVLP